MNTEKVRQNIKELIMPFQTKGKEKASIGCYEMVKILMELPFNQVGFQLRGYKLLGDLFTFFRDYRIALLYYMQGVRLNKHLEIIC